MTSFADRARTPGAARTGTGGKRVNRPAPYVPRPPWAPVQLIAPTRSVSAGKESAAAPNRTGLPDALKAGVEALSGLAMDDVRVHRNSSAPATLGALAYTQGSDIHVGPGQERHLPHEAWHVVQQKQGRVAATLQMKSGLALNDDPALEREADAMGTRALTPEAGAAVTKAARSGTATPQAVQRMSVRGTKTDSVVSSDTHKKHVVAESDRAAAAQAGYGSRTFVAADSDLTTPVDAHLNNFTEANGKASDRVDFNADVTIYQYDKRTPLPAGLKKGEPVDLTVDGEARSCEIGAEKNGVDAIKITHCMKNP
jgi:hypothetical protein